MPPSERAKWIEGHYNYSTLTAGFLVLTVGWATSGGGYEWSTNVSVRGTKKYKDRADAQRAAEAWARKALAEAASALAPPAPSGKDGTR